MKEAMLDTVKTAAIGTSGIAVTWMDWLPVVVRIAFGLISVVYMFYKAKVEWLNYVEKKEALSKKGNSNAG
jgi:hypothetical protein